jgi:uncharacterized membrane protein YozB (DUF420 family)
LLVVTLMSILEDPYALAALGSLIVQIVVLFLLVYGYALKRKTKFRSHGTIMAAAVVIHLITIVAIMIPSLILAIIPQFIVTAPLELISIIGTIHGITGIIAIILGIGLVGTWRFSKDITGCFKRKSIMRITISVWIIALVLGIALYFALYSSLLQL